MRAISIVLSHALFALVSCSEETAQDIPAGGRVVEVTAAPAKEEVVDPVAKSAVEQTISNVRTGIEFIREISEDKKKRDSVFVANKHKFFAYQIGLPREDRDQIVDAFNRLTNTSGIYIFKHSRKNYCLIKFESLAEQTLKDSLASFIRTLGDLGKQGVSIVNLTELCWKKDIKEGEPYRRKKDIEIPCLICD